MSSVSRGVEILKGPKEMLEINTTNRNEECLDVIHRSDPAERRIFRPWGYLNRKSHTEKQTEKKDWKTGL